MRTLYLIWKIFQVVTSIKHIIRNNKSLCTVVSIIFSTRSTIRTFLRFAAQSKIMFYTKESYSAVIMLRNQPKIIVKL
jgi:hypothetical protein